jgi:rfaE bifunctional protein kinase chain/domain
MPPLDLSHLKTYPLAQRRNLVHLADLLDPEAPPPAFTSPELEAVAQHVIAARRAGCPVIWMMGAHVIKSGLSRLLVRLLEEGIITHVAGNGAVSIHDFELALIGETSEDVPHGLEDGSFGMAEETSALMHQALAEGVPAGLGYGASIGRFMDQNPEYFPHRAFSVLYTAYHLGMPATIHITIGADIIHQHPKADFATLGAASGRDFRLFTTAVSQLEGGVFLNFGSAVTGPEIFLKALTVARNLGFTTRHITTANFDLRSLPDYHAPVSAAEPDYYYRPRKNIINRPTAHGGQGYHVTGDHAVTIPNLAALLRPALSGLAARPAQISPARRTPRPVATPAGKEGKRLLTWNEMQALLNYFSGLRIGVLGDLALDAYWTIDMTRSRLSRETPLFPRPVVSECYAPGAGGNTAQNLAALGVAQVQVFSVIGEDNWGDRLLSALKEGGIAPDGVLRSASRRTTAYIKPLLTGYDAQQEDARFDFENPTKLSPALEDALLARLEAALPDLDALIIVDQLDLEGVVTPRVRQRLNALAADATETGARPVFVVDSRLNIAAFHGMALKPNRVEAYRALHPAGDPRSASISDMETIGLELSRRAGQPVFVTLGENGALVCESGQARRIPAGPTCPPLDPTGAGDTYCAALTAALAAGASAGRAAQVAGLAAAVTVEKLRQTGAATPAEILARHALAYPEVVT